MTDKKEIKDGLVEEFYDNGQLKFRWNYKNGKNTVYGNTLMKKEI